MKIDGKKTGIGSDIFVARTGETPGVNKAQAPEAPAPPAPKSADAVEISAKARDLARVKKMLESVPELRGELVIRLKTDIANGDYNVDASKVAEKMIERALRDVLSSKG